jgi:hypothetical protein
MSPTWRYSLMSSSSSSHRLLTVRTAVVLLIAVVVGIGAGVLGFLAYRDVPVALLLAGGAGGSALALFHNLLARR